MNPGFCHCWEASGQQIPSWVSLPLAGSFRSWASLWRFGCSQFDCPWHALLSQPVRSRVHHSQSQVWNFCVHLDKGLRCYASSGIFSKAGAVPAVLPHFWVCLVVEKCKGRKPKWGKKGDHLNDDFQKGEKQAELYKWITIQWSQKVRRMF